MENPFTLLGLTHGVSTEEIKRAYRRLAMQWHPDRNPTREAEEHFKRIKAAYEILLDPVQRADWESGRAPDDDAEVPSNESADMVLSLDLEEAASGCAKTLTLDTKRSCAECDGKGSIELRASVACSSCQGVGRIRSGRSSTTCTVCGGRGYVRIASCSACTGRGWTTSARQVTLRVPAGMQTGERLRLARQHRPRDGEVATDLFVALVIRPHSLFSLDGKDLLCTVPVNIFRLLHGGTLEIPTLNGIQQISIQPYPGHGLEYKLPGLGYPGRHGRGVGHLRLKLQPVFPDHLTDVELKLLFRLEKLVLEKASTQAPELAAWERKLAQTRSRSAE